MRVPKIADVCILAYNYLVENIMLSRGAEGAAQEGAEGNNSDEDNLI